VPPSNAITRKQLQSVPSKPTRRPSAKRHPEAKSAPPKQPDSRGVRRPPAGHQLVVNLLLLVESAPAGTAEPLVCGGRGCFSESAAGACRGFGQGEQVLGSKEESIFGLWWQDALRV